MRTRRRASTWVHGACRAAPTASGSSGTTHPGMGRRHVRWSLDWHGAHLGVLGDGEVGNGGVEAHSVSGVEHVGGADVGGGEGPQCGLAVGAGDDWLFGGPLVTGEG